MGRKKLKHLKSVASLLVVFLLFTSVIASSFSLLTIFKEVRELVLTKKTNSPYKTDVQLPFEEREKEEEESQVIRFFVGFVVESVFVFDTETSLYYSYHTPSNTGHATGNRIYLFNRTLLI
jgi:hypothetical protein